MTGSVTRAVLLTPRGRGAVATIRIEGAGALAAADTVLHAVSARPLADLSPGRIALARFDDPEHGEEVVVCLHGDEAIEIHCHGGLAAPEAILARLERLGCIRTSGHDWLQRREKNPIRTEAFQALLQVPTRRAAAILLDQYNGAFEERLAEVIACLDAGKAGAALRVIRHLLQYRHLADRLDRPWRVALAGPVNAGKSSLLNALLGFERAIVQDRPGTTRDVLTARTALDGWPIDLSDTAGLREIEDGPPEEVGIATEGQIEAAGIERARLYAAEADLVLLVFDRTAGWSAAQQALRQLYPASLGLLNKSDLPAPVGEKFPADLLPISARTGEGLEQLVGRILDRLVQPIPTEGEAVPFRERHIRLLDAATEMLCRNDSQQARRYVSDIFVS